MPFARLYELLPDLAARETRTISNLRADGTSGEGFSFIEMFCNETGCDCRRVVFQIVSSLPPARVLAHVSYGWEPDAFYRKWASFPLDDDDLEELRGPGLMRMSTQSERAEEMLALARVVLDDEAYVARIVRHYQMFRDRIDAKAFARAQLRQWRSPSRKKRRVHG